MTTIDRYGIRVPVPDGWHGRIRQRPNPSAADRRAAATPASQEVSRPVLHLATRSLPSDLADFGGEVVAGLGSDDIFLALVDYGTAVADQGLFARQGLPRLAPSQFSPNRMAQYVPGRSACQHFFSEAGRAFCLYAVVGAHSRRMATVPRLARAAQGMRLRPSAAAGGGVG